MKELVEKIIEYTKTWSISETEWYWNMTCSRKSETYINGKCEKEITWEEFERAIREEMLYDLVYRNGAYIRNQMENDICNYTDELFYKDSEELEEEIKKIISDFEVERYYKESEE